MTSRARAWRSGRGVQAPGGSRGIIGRSGFYWPMAPSVFPTRWSAPARLAILLWMGAARAVARCNQVSTRTNWRHGVRGEDETFRIDARIRSLVTMLVVVCPCLRSFSCHPASRNSNSRTTLRTRVSSWTLVFGHFRGTPTTSESWWCGGLSWALLCPS